MIDLRYSSLKFPLSDDVRRSLEDAATEASSYPDPKYEELRRILAGDAGADVSEVVVGNGLDDVIDQLSRILEGPSFIPVPAFSEFARACKRNRKGFNIVPCLKNGRMDLASLFALGRLKGSVVWLANPNNPTGTVYDDEQIEMVLSTDAMVVLDEAYLEFLPIQNSKKWKNHDNVIRLRTFSKALGLPGARLGYAISSNKAVLKAFESQRPLFPVNCMGLAAARCLKTLRSAMPAKIATVNNTRKRFVERIARAGYEAIPSVANFVVVDFRTREMTERVLQKMRENDILLLPPWDEEFSGLPDRYIRFVIGENDEMDAVANVLEAIRK